MGQVGTLSQDGEQDDSCLSDIVYKAHFTPAVRATLFSCLLNAYQLLPDLLAL